MKSFYIVTASAVKNTVQLPLETIFYDASGTMWASCTPNELGRTEENLASTEEYLCRMKRSSSITDVNVQDKSREEIAVGRT